MNPSPSFNWGHQGLLRTPHCREDQQTEEYSLTLQRQPMRVQPVEFRVLSAGVGAWAALRLFRSPVRVAAVSRPWPILR